MNVLAAGCGFAAIGVESDEHATEPVRRHGIRSSARLLLAEDNLINQKVAVGMLSHAGYRVDLALNGAAAIEAVATESYDAILMDCHMPILDGYEATRAIRAREGPDEHIPIVAVTAGSRLEDRQLCLSVGMDAYIAKPFTKDTLLTVVGDTIRDATSAARPAAIERDETDSPEQEPA